MAYAQELKNLVAEIKIGRTDRAARIKEIKGETRDILAEADAYMQKVVAELKDATKDIKDFLAKSEGARKKDFNAMMGGIQARIQEIKGDVKDFIAKSGEKRIVDFKALMKDVTGAVDTIRKSTKDLLGDYKAERNDAARYWASIRGKEEAEKVPIAPKRKGGGKK